MPAKIRLQRFGKKGRPFFHIVIADGRAPRDGRFIEKLGTYNPLTKPAEIIIDFDKTLKWVQDGAVPSDTVKAILFYKGVMYKHHLLKGVKKGAMTEEQAEARFQEWLLQKESKISNVKRQAEQEVSKEEKERIAAEIKVNQAKAEAIAKKYAKEAAKEAAAAEHEVAAAEVAAIAAAEPVAEAEAVVEPVTEAVAEPVAEVVEEPVAEVVEEPVAEVVEEPVAEVAPVAEEAVAEPVVDETQTEPAAEETAPEAQPEN